MEKFLSIDWTPTLEDIVDSTFIKDDRLEREGVTYKILAGTFTDPFINIQNDCKGISVEALMELEDVSSDEESDDDKKPQETELKPKSQMTQAKKPYVPGIVKPLFKFPRKSNLTQEEQALCLRVLLRFSESDKPKITQTEREELQTYMNLQQSISQEQAEFFEFAKSKWPCRQFKLVHEDYINLRWKSKLQNITKLPRHYAEIANIPFIGNKNVSVKLNSVCLKMGNLAKIILPTFARSCMLHTSSEELESRFPPTNYVSKKSAISYKLPVSEDQTCQKLAEENNVDLVISSSGLNCLVNNIGPNYSKSWILPIVIREHNGKSIAYIDKAIPPAASTIPEKNTWVYKYILRRFFVHTRYLKSRRMSNNVQISYTDDVFGNVSSEELLRLEDQYENTSLDSDNKLPLNTIKETNSVERDLQAQNLNSDNDEPPVKKIVSDCEESNSNVTNSILGSISNTNERESGQEIKAEVDIEWKQSDKPKIKKPKKIAETKKNVELSNENVSYKLFTIRAHSPDENELLKDNTTEEYKILVRTKTDGFEKLDTGEMRLLMLAPKLEHQVDFGAESVTLEEALKQWISLIFRPDTFLARVRISAETSEVLQIERRTAVSINNEIKRLYNVKAEDSLTVLYNTVQSLTSLDAGRYVLRHTIRNGAFATVYKETDSAGKNTFDLHTVCGQEFHTLPCIAWLPIDKIVPNPMQKCFERMPAMFCPIKSSTLTNKRKNMNKNTKAAVRRSLRNKNNNG